MGANSIYFVKSGVSLKDIKDYLNKTYGIFKDYTSENDYIGDICPTISGRIYFGDENDRYCIFVFIPGYNVNPKESNVPVEAIAGVSISLVADTNEKDINMLNGIAKKFGGYICKNDCGDTSQPDYWKYIEASNPKDTSVVSDTSHMEGKIFNMLKSYNQKIGLHINEGNSPKMEYIVEFLKENIDEIKKL